MANGQDNKDGANDNESWNCGAEGETDDFEIRKLRARQQRNLLATLFFSQGVPMLSHGDELGRTQGGNNNAYCQDNETTWIDWNLDEERRALQAFAKRVIELRKDRPILRRTTFARGEPVHGLGIPDLSWFQPDGQPVTDETWTDANARLLGMRLASSDGCLLLLLNAYWEDVDFVLPPANADGAGVWHVLVDTSEAPRAGEGAAGATFPLQSRSAVLLAGSTR